MREATINKVNKISYVSDGSVTGLTDLMILIKRPDGIALPTSAMAEEGDGLYSFSYTPDISGYWTEIISSVSNGDYIIRSVKVVSSDILDANIKLNDIEIKNDAIKTVVDGIDNKINNLPTAKRYGYFA